MQQGSVSVGSRGGEAKARTGPKPWPSLPPASWLWLGTFYPSQARRSQGLGRPLRGPVPSTGRGIETDCYPHSSCTSWAECPRPGSENSQKGVPSPTTQDLKQPHKSQPTQRKRKTFRETRVQSREETTRLKRAAGTKLQTWSKFLAGKNRKRDKAGSRGAVMRKSMSDNVRNLVTGHRTPRGEHQTETHYPQPTTMGSGSARVRQKSQDPASN